MTPERWRQIEGLYHKALESQGEDRAALLAASDPELRREVEELLAQGGSMLSLPAWADADAPGKGLQAGAKIGPYEITGQLGAGGMGEVFRARDSKLHREVAIKALPGEYAGDPEHLSRFQREARMLAALNHPNIAAIYGIEESGGASFLVLELVDGETLAERIQRTGALPVEEALPVAAQLADALEAAHASGITHRDIKPSNIKITPAGRVKVLDFGLAKAGLIGTPENASALSTVTQTEPGRLMGTPAYMSPEQVHGRPSSPRSDIWAFGCVLYEMLAAIRAFRGESLSGTLAAVLERQPDWDALPAETPQRIRELLRKCLEKEPNRRLAGMGEVRAAIEPIPETRHGMSRRAAAAIAGGALAALGLPVALDLGGVRSRWFSLPAPAIRSIAVLPLVNGSSDPEQEYFTDGITESLITSVSRLGGVRVTSRTSTMHYKGTTLTSAEIARELGVDALVEGSVARSGTRVRITARLIDPGTQQEIWTESYDRELTDILILQSGIARTIARQIQLRVEPEAEAILARAGEVDPEGYDTYLQGQEHLYRLQPGEIDTAERLFEEAVQANPDFALAYAGLAQVWAFRQQGGLVTAQVAAPVAVRYAEQARALDDSLDEVHFTLASIRGFVEWKWQEAETEYRRALALNPSNAGAHGYYAHILLFQKRISEALEHAEEAVRLDPRNALVLTLRGMVRSHAGRDGDAEADFRAALEVEPGNRAAGANLATLLARTGRIGELPKGGKGGAAADPGAAAARMEARAATEFVPPQTVADFYARAGNMDKAIEWLERAVEARDPNTPYVNVAREWDALRDDVRFQGLIRRMGLPTE